MVVIVAYILRWLWNCGSAIVDHQKEKKEKKRIKQAIEIANLKLLCLAYFIVFEIANIKQAINKSFKTKIKVSEQPVLSQIKFLVLSF